MACLSGTMSTKGSVSTSKACVFCNLTDDNEVEYGKIYEHNGIVTHYYCLLLSSNMEQKGDDNEGILGFLAEDIQKELRRGKRLACSYCKKIGATLGCCNVKCKRIFHFPCGLKAGSLHQFFGEFRSFCVNHRPKQKIDDQILKQVCSVDNVFCYICYDKVSTDDFVKTLWAPCCKKDAWFHRYCIQQLALSAGYFFKCPLCNNKKDFQKAMLEYGIFVPSQDASWELVPNAFEELLYRHNQCDAQKCLCPKGRSHISNNAKWELTLCRTCGSQGIHMACGQLKWANPVWDCYECASILSNSERNKQIRLSDSTALDRPNSGNKDSNLNFDLDSNSDLDSNLNSDLDSDLDNDTDISVGTEFPTQYSLNNSSSSISLVDSVLDIRLRPGPRSFKLQQQMINRLNVPNTDLGKNVAIEANPKDINKLSNNNDEGKEPSTSKENTSQQESKKNSSEEENQLSNKISENSQSTQKEADIITIESEDDDVELISLTRKTNDLPIQPGNSHISSMSISQMVESSLNAIIKEPMKFKNQSVITIDLSKNDNIAIPRFTVSNSQTQSINKPAVSNQVSVATPQRSVLEIISLNDDDSEEANVVDTNETSIMNIKITNVTSLPPEVFDRVPNVYDDIALQNNTLSRNRVLTQLTTPGEELLVSSTKRSMHEASDVTDSYKKVKRNNFDEKSGEMKSTPVSVIVTCNKSNTNDTSNTNNINSTNKQQDKSTFTSKFSESSENNLSTRISETVSIFNPPLNKEKNNLTIQTIPLHNKTNDLQHASQSHLERNGMLVKQQCKEKCVTHGNREYMTVAKGNQLIVQIPPTSSFYLQQIPNPNFGTSSQNADKADVYAIPSNSIILPRVRDVTVLGTNQPLQLNQSVIATPVLNDNQRGRINPHKVVMHRDGSYTIENPQKVVVHRDGSYSIENTSSVRNNSSNTSYCDGDAGTRPAETDSGSRKNDGSSDDSHRSVAGQHIVSQSSVTSHNVFPQVTNNHNTCHQPRLIPRYVNLQDLKFQICESNNIQMTLYDTFSVNIPMKNPKESKNRPVAASRKSRESSVLASRGPSCSSDYIDNHPSERQRSEKFLRSSTNENYSISDKSTCAKYIAHGQDDTKENLDPTKTRMLSHNGTLSNVNTTDNVDAVIMNDRSYGENNERLVSSDTNLSVLNQTICNMNIDDTDGVMLVSNSCNQGTQDNVEDIQQHKVSVRSAILASEERPGARIFCKKTNKIHIDFDFNVVNMNKNTEKISQDDITVSTSQHADGDRIGNDCKDNSPTLWNSYKPIDDGTNVRRSKVNNRNVARVSNITRFSERSMMNKQIDTCGRKLTRCLAFQENTVCNGETRAKSNEFCLKVSVDLCKIQNLIDSKPELFENREHDANDQQCKRTSRLFDLDDYARQVRYCNIENSDRINNCLPKSKELQSNYICNVEHMQRDVFPTANTFLRYQKSNPEIINFDKDVLDR